MGQAVSARFVADEKVELVGAVDPGGMSDRIATSIDKLPLDLKADVALDFSTAQAVRENIEPCLKRGWDVLIGVTGLGEDDYRTFGGLALKYSRRVVLVPNFTIGMNILLKAAREAAKFFKHVEIIELHHDKKVDAPSGTAIHTAHLIAGERKPSLPPGGDSASRGLIVDGIPVHSVRLQGLLAHQEVIFGNEGEVLTIRHDTMERSAFMSGIYMAIEKLPSMESGFTIGF
jgi:4-hydroxy-tetrahydrodipicolinate reductase